MLYSYYNIIQVIRTFGNRLAKDLYDDMLTRVARQFPLPPTLRDNARRKLPLIDDASSLRDLSALPGNRFEKLRGDRSGVYSIRINEQWRVTFRWQDGDAYGVMVEDYH